MNIKQDLIKIAKEILSYEFPNEKALKDYLRDHPKAKRENHSVLKQKQKVKTEDKTKTQKSKIKIPEHIDPKWFFHPRSKERPVYHGTSKKGIEAIKKTGQLKPFVSDSHEYGAAVFWTTDIEEAKDYMTKGGAIIETTLGNVSTKKNKKHDGYPLKLKSALLKDIKNAKTKEEKKKLLYEYLRDGNTLSVQVLEPISIKGMKIHTKV